MNALDDGGFGPLHEAAIEGSVATMELLIRNGALVNEMDFDGETPILLAARHAIPRRLWPGRCMC